MNFNFLGGLSKLLPGYVQGQRLAVQDNWQDLMNYNQVQQGQLSNAFTEVTFQPRLNMFRNAMMNDNFRTYGNMVNARLTEIMRPYHEMQAMAWNYYAPQLAGIGPQSTLQMWDIARRNPNLMQAVQGAAGSTPTNIG